MAAEPHRIDLAERPRRDCPALFLDRDGTLIEDPGYVADPDQVVLIPGVVGALRRFRDAGYALVVVTNQSGLGRGFYGWDDYEAVAARLAELVGAEGVIFDAVLACAHAPRNGAPCTWRKPGPGMILEAAALLSLDLSRSLLVGDKLRDLQAAEGAGLSHAFHVTTGQGASEREAISAWRSDMAVELVDGLAALAP